MTNKSAEMANESVEMATDAFAVALESLKRANGEVGRYMAKIKEIEDELEEWKKINPRYFEDVKLRHHYEGKKLNHKEAYNCLNKAYDCVDNAHDRLKKAGACVLQLYQPACQVSSSYTGIHPKSFRGMIPIQRQRQGSPKVTKESLISLSLQKESSSIAFKEGALGAFDASKNTNHPNMESNFVVTLGTHTDGLNPITFAFKRDNIWKKMFNWMNFQERMNRFLLLDSPAASGKTTLLIMFRLQYPQLNVHYISMISKSNPYDCLLSVGLDVMHRICKYDQVIYILDDAQILYDHPSFCHTLVKDIPLLFSGVQFIISVTHKISTRDQPNPFYFEGLEKISKEDLLFSSDQSLELLNSQPPLGLPTHMQNFSQLKNTIIEHCNGLVGALRESAKFFVDSFCVHTSTEVMYLQAYYSKNLLDQMHGCFGIVCESCIPANANDILLKCVLGESFHSILDVDHSISGIITSFAKAGILTIDEHKRYGFSSILAKRYFLHCYSQHRAISDPSTLCELVVKAIKSMSAKSLMSSTSSQNDFPKEATFQHLFMVGLLKHTSCNTAICTELSRLSATNNNKMGETDFIMDGDLMWGIAMVTRGYKIGEHLSQFGPKGKYAGLHLNDFIVLDFCKGGNGVTNVIQDSHTATASFTVDAAGYTCYKNVVFRYGNDKPLTLHLQP